MGGGKNEEFRNSGSLATVAAYAYSDLRLLLATGDQLPTGLEVGCEGGEEKRREESAGDGVVERSSFFAAAEGAENAVEE